MNATLQFLFLRTVVAALTTSTQSQLLSKVKTKELSGIVKAHNAFVYHHLVPF